MRLRCTISRRSVVQRWPAVPAAANTIARRLKARSAEGVTMAALLPPSSSSVRPKRAATLGPRARPMAVLPVALTSGISAWLASCSPASRRPITSCEMAAGAAGISAITSLMIRCSASAVSGVFSEGFHSTVSPQTSASAAFQHQTAIGKLKAVMTPTGPSGCQRSIRWCPGRSEAMVRP